jgi:hypothetical protein
MQAIVPLVLGTLDPGIVPQLEEHYLVGLRNCTKARGTIELGYGDCTSVSRDIGILLTGNSGVSHYYKGKSMDFAQELSSSSCLSCFSSFLHLHHRTNHQQKYQMDQQFQTNQKNQTDQQNQMGQQHQTHYP